MREDLDLTMRKEKILLWRRITRTIKDLYVNNKDIVNNDTQNTLPSSGNVETDTVNCESTKNPEGLGEALPVSDRETTPEVVRVYAGVAISALDISVGAVIDDHRP